MKRKTETHHRWYPSLENDELNENSKNLENIGKK